MSWSGKKSERKQTMKYKIVLFLILVLGILLYAGEMKSGKDRVLLRTFVNDFEDVLFVSLWAKPPFRSYPDIYIVSWTVFAQTDSSRREREQFYIHDEKGQIDNTVFQKALNFYLMKIREMAEEHRPLYTGKK